MQPFRRGGTQERELPVLHFSANDTVADPTTRVVAIIQAEAAQCLAADIGINFENKIVLSIAIRLAAERYMIDKINDLTFVNGIDANQTRALLNRFKNQFANDTAEIQVMQRVALMAPENIHLNSFMYEPILDMSDEYLRNLRGESTPTGSFHRSKRPARNGVNR